MAFITPNLWGKKKEEVQEPKKTTLPFFSSDPTKVTMQNINDTVKPVFNNPINTAIDQAAKGQSYVPFSAGYASQYQDPTKTAIEPNTNIPSSNGIVSTPAPTVSPTQSVDDSVLKKYIADMAEAKRKSAIANLDNAKASSLQGLDAEQTTIAPKYYDARNQAASQSQQSANSFAEYMANRGLTRSGRAAGAEMQRLSSLQSTLGGLSQAEANAIADIERRRTGINTTYNNDVVSANSGIDADTMAQYIDAYKTEQARQDALDQFNKTYGLQMNQFNEQKNQNSLENAYRDKTFDYQKGIDNRNFDYQQTQDEYTRAMEQKKMDESIRQFDKQFAENQRQWNAENSLNTRQQTLAERQAQIDNAYKRGQLSLDQAQLQLQRDKVAIDNDPNSLDNKYKKAQINSLNIENAKGSKFNSNVNLTVDDYVSGINQQFVTKDLSDNVVIDKQGIADYLNFLANQGVDETILKNVGGRYGLGYQSESANYTKRPMG